MGQRLMAARSQRETLTAADIGRLLDARHAKDVIVHECNVGSAQAGCRRLDTWVLRKSWSPWTTIGYEIKVSRADFLRDDKWTSYLPYCHELYFACAAKLIAPEELPADVGLLWASANGARFFVKRRAVRRQPEPSAIVRLMSYVLMSRTRIVADMWEADGPEAVERWRRWLLEEDGERHIGHMVGRRLAERLRDAERRVYEAERKVSRYEHVESLLREWGLDPADAPGLYDIRQRLAGDQDRLRGTVQQAHRLAQQLARLTDGA